MAAAGSWKRIFWIKIKNLLDPKIRKPLKIPKIRKPFDPKDTNTFQFIRYGGKRKDMAGSRNIWGGICPLFLVREIR